MPGTTGPRRINRCRVAVVVLYAFVIAASAFFHNDFACRQDSRTHCISCSVGQDAQKVEAHAIPLDAIDRLAGRVEARASHIAGTLTSCSISDRSPPAAV
jgi:hypothetical protein